MKALVYALVCSMTLTHQILKYSLHVQIHGHMDLEEFLILTTCLTLPFWSFISKMMELFGDSGPPRQIFNRPDQARARG